MEEPGCSYPEERARCPVPPPTVCSPMLPDPYPEGSATLGTLPSPSGPREAEAWREGGHHRQKGMLCPGFKSQLPSPLSLCALRDFLISSFLETMFNVFTKSCNHHHSPLPDRFHHLDKNPLPRRRQAPFSSLPQPPGNHTHFMSMDAHAMCCLLWLAFFP